ncbi:MAG: phosphoglycerate kinase [Verrucomicrobia bacterium]|nr:phosphoglycerate kinase [Verrucomicrobiota bacterium]
MVTIRYKTLHDVHIKGRRVLIRVDFNVPLDGSGNIQDETKIRSSLPTIRYILEHGGSVILMSHLGRPEGKRNPLYSLAPVAKRLSLLLEREVTLAPDCIGEAVERLSSRLAPGGILLLENLRFHEGEEHPEKQPSFVESLSKLGDIYVDDAFAVAHRKHASNYAIVDKYKEASIGFLVEKEVLILNNLLTQAKSPFYAIIGGSKIGSKIGVLEALLDKVSALFIGGGMAFTFFKAQGFEVGDSLVDLAHLETAKQLIKRCRAKDVTLHLPIDIVIGESLSPEAEVETVLIEDGIPKGFIGADIGKRTIEQWKKYLQDAQTIFWNGPVGVFELPPFRKGTQEIAETLSKSKAITIIGGGDSASAVHQLHLDQRMTCISTGGGATLEFIEFGTLPALDKLSKK